MPVKYQIDGDIFQEITENWLYVYVKEYKIKARMVETDQVGNIIENFQINDGRVFTRQIQKSNLENAGEAEEAKQFELARLCLQK